MCNESSSWEDDITRSIVIVLEKKRKRQDILMHERRRVRQRSSSSHHFLSIEENNPNNQSFVNKNETTPTPYITDRPADHVDEESEEDRNESYVIDKSIPVKEICRFLHRAMPNTCGRPV